MQIKFQKKLDEYKYILSFDIATHTGYSLYSIEEDKFITWGEIVVSDKDGFPPYVNFYYQLEDLLIKICSFVNNKPEVLCIKEKQVLQMMGHTTTVATIVNMAKLHAIFDEFMINSNIDVYDYEGLPVPTHKAYYRRVLGKKDITKQDVMKWVLGYYSISDKGITDNITDSMCFILPFMEKWNKDIDEEIRGLKREKKSLKMPKAIQERDNEIMRLSLLKI